MIICILKNLVSITEIFIIFQKTIISKLVLFYIYNGYFNVICLKCDIGSAHFLFLFLFFIFLKVIISKIVVILLISS